ncbi:MAG: PAS domain-containing protein [Betaproteobacteria bacterium]|nr:PAS domain-containing protein [Betaproteobacteria bacterium]
MLRLILRLETHQIELELQNEELRKVRAELEENYDELYDFAPVGYFTLEPHGRIEKANLTGASMLGRPRPWLLNRPFAAFVAPESLPAFENFLRRTFEGCEKESCMVTLVRGGTIPVAAYIEASRAGSDSSCRVVVVDITSAEQARLALRESEIRLKLALDTSGMGVWEWERDTGDIYWSPECFTIFGVDCFCPTQETLAQLLHPEDAPRVRSILNRALADGRERSVECRIIRPDGEVVWIFARGQVQCDKAGKPLRLIGIVQDITQRKREAQIPACDLEIAGDHFTTTPE